MRCSCFSSSQSEHIIESDPSDFGHVTVPIDHGVASNFVVITFHVVSGAPEWSVKDLLVLACYQPPLETTTPGETTPSPETTATPAATTTSSVVTTAGASSVWWAPPRPRLILPKTSLVEVHSGAIQDHSESSHWVSSQSRSHASTQSSSLPMVLLSASLHSAV